MSVRERLLPRTEQPQETVRLDDANPLLRGLAFVWNAASSSDDVTGLLPNTDNTTRVASEVGVARQCALSQTNIEWNREAILTSDGAGTGDFTVAVFAKAAAYNTAAEHLFAQKNDAAGSPFSQMSMLVHANSSAAASSGSFNFFTYSSTSVTTAIAGGVAVGEWRLYGGRRRGQGLTAFAGPSLTATASGLVKDIANGTRRTAIGSRGNGTTESYRGEVAFAAAWNRALSDAEWADLCANPWQIFEPNDTPVFYSIASGSNASVAVPAASLALTGNAPTVAVSAHQTVAVPAGSLSLASYAPTVAVSDHKTVAVPAASLSVTGYAPTVSIGDAKTVAVPAASLALAAHAPTVTASDHKTVAVPAAALALQAYAPTVVSDGSQVVQVPRAQLALQAYAPTVSAAAPALVAVPAASLQVNAYAPSVVTPLTVAVPAASLALAGYAPVVQVGGGVQIEVPAASLSLVAYAPVVAGDVPLVAAQIGNRGLGVDSPTFDPSRVGVDAPRIGTRRIGVSAPKAFRRQ